MIDLWFFILPVTWLIAIISFAHLLWTLFVRPVLDLRAIRIRILLAFLIAPVFGVGAGLFFLDFINWYVQDEHILKYFRSFDLKVFLIAIFMLGWAYVAPALWVIVQLGVRALRNILLIGMGFSVLGWLTWAFSMGSLSFGHAMMFWHVFIPFSFIVGLIASFFVWLIAFYRPDYGSESHSLVLNRRDADGNDQMKR